MSKKQLDEGRRVSSDNWGEKSVDKFDSFGFKIDQAEDLTMEYVKSSQENWASSQSSVVSSARRSNTPKTWSNTSWSWGQSACPPPLRSPWSSDSSCPIADWSEGSGGREMGPSWKGRINGESSRGGSGTNGSLSWGKGSQSWRQFHRGSGGSQSWGRGNNVEDMARFSGLTYGDVMKITVHQEMEKLNMIRKEEPVNLSSIFKKVSP